MEVEYSAMKEWPFWATVRESDKRKAAKLLEKDLINSPFHCFGQHSKCSPDFCKTAQSKVTTNPAASPPTTSSAISSNLATSSNPATSSATSSDSATSSASIDGFLDEVHGKLSILHKEDTQK